MIVILFLATAATHGWMTTLEFQLDDYEQVFDAEDLSRPAVLLGQDSAEQRGDRARPTFVQFFRPVLHYSFALDVFLFGADPFALHLSSVAWHFLTVVLFFFALARILPARNRRLALFAAVIFAVHPGKWGAVSWIAARGDLLMTSFFLGALLALTRFRRRGGWPWLVASFVLVTGSLFCKEGAVVCPVLLAMIDFVVLRRERGDIPWRRGLVVAVPLVLLAPAYLGFRQWKFAEMANFYAGRTRVFTWDMVVRMASDLSPTFSRLAGGYFHYEDGSLMTWLQSTFTTLLFVTAAVWVSRRPLRRSLAVLFLGLLYLVSALPTLRFYLEASGFDASRLFYLPALFLSVFMALPLQGLRSRLKMFRWGALLYVAAAIALFALSGFHHMRSQLRAADLVARVRQDLNAIAAASGRSDIGYAILELPNEVDHAPTYGTFLTYAFRPPFSEKEIIARNVISLELTVRGLALYAVPIPIQFLEWVSDSETERDHGRLVPRSGILPSPKGWQPRLEFRTGSTVLEIPEGLAPRDVRALRIELRDTSTAFAGRLVFSDEYGKSWDAPLAWKPDGRPLDALYVPVESEEGWVMRGHIVRVEAVADEGPPPPVSVIDCSATFPALELVKPADGENYSVSGSPPRIVFRDPIGHPWYRIRLFLDAHTLTWTLPKERFEKLDDQGTLAHASDGPGFLPGEDHGNYWAELRPGGGSDLLSRFGVGSVRFSVKVEGLRGEPSAGSYAQAATKIVSAVITR